MHFEGQINRHRWLVPGRYALKITAAVNVGVRTRPNDDWGTACARNGGRSWTYSDTIAGRYTLVFNCQPISLTAFEKQLAPICSSIAVEPAQTTSGFWDPDLARCFLWSDIVLHSQPALLLFTILPTSRAATAGGP